MSSSWVHSCLVSRCEECPYCQFSFDVSGKASGLCEFFLDSQMTDAWVKPKEAPPELCPLREGPVTLSLMPGV